MPPPDFSPPGRPPETPPPEPPPPEPRWSSPDPAGSNRFLLPVLATVTYLAVVIAVFGFTSLLLDRDVIDVPDAGTLLGPVLVAFSCAVTFVALLRVPGRRGPTSVALAAAASVYLGMILLGGVAYAWGNAEAVSLFLFASRQATSPFAIAASLGSGAFVIAYWVVLARQSR